MSKTLVLYVFHVVNNRVQHFINNCIFDDKNVDFIIISNNKDNKFIVPNGVKVLLRDNVGYDFGGWSEALLVDDLYKNYDKFIFVNSSVIGPFIPSYYKGKWTDVYIDGLQNNVKLFGSTINTISQPLTKSHVQSYIFSMDINTLQYLISREIFSMTNYAKTFGEAIWLKEVKMSREIINNGWNIGSLFKHYKNVDFTFSTKTPSEYNIEFFGDIMFHVYMNKLWNEYDLVFIKGNRIDISI
jgi:lipopolysaccharide biosynthesis protein